MTEGHWHGHCDPDSDSESPFKLRMPQCLLWQQRRGIAPTTLNAPLLHFAAVAKPWAALCTALGPACQWCTPCCPTR